MTHTRKSSAGGWPVAATAVVMDVYAPFEPEMHTQKQRDRQTDRQREREREREMERETVLTLVS
jgi:hypothetical protein